MRRSHVDRRTSKRYVPRQYVSEYTKEPPPDEIKFVSQRKREALDFWEVEEKIEPNDNLR